MEGRPSNALECAELPAWGAVVCVHSAAADDHVKVQRGEKGLCRRTRCAGLSPPFLPASTLRTAPHPWPRPRLQVSLIAGTDDGAALVSADITDDRAALRVPNGPDDADNFAMGVGIDLCSGGVTGPVAHPFDPDAGELPPQPLFWVRTRRPSWGGGLRDEAACAGCFVRRRRA